MADVNITNLAPATDSPLTNVDIAQGTAINPANTYYLDPVDQGRMIFIIKNTYAGAKTVTVHAGTGPAAGIGDLEQSLAQNVAALFCLETARFAQADGTFKVTFESGTTGYIMAFKLPADF